MKLPPKPYRALSLEIADDVLELIKALYRIEGQVKQEGLEGSEEHLNLQPPPIHLDNDFAERLLRRIAVGR